MGSSIFDEVFQAVSFAALDLPGVGGIACGTIATPLAEAQLTAERAVDDALAFALALALLQWVADIGDADREMARACIALDTLVRFSAARGEPLPPLNADVVENFVPVNYTQAPDARAELDAWIRAGIEAHAYGSAICDESGKPVSVEELNEWAKVKP